MSLNSTELTRCPSFRPNSQRGCNEFESLVIVERLISLSEQDIYTTDVTCNTDNHVVEWVNTTCDISLILI